MMRPLPAAVAAQTLFGRRLVRDLNYMRFVLDRASFRYATNEEVNGLSLKHVSPEKVTTFTIDPVSKRFSETSVALPKTFSGFEFKSVIFDELQKGKSKYEGK